MSTSSPKPSPDTRQRQRALANWENEGGAGPYGPLDAVQMLGHHGPLPKMGEAEMVALYVRVIALENLVIALLATASDEQRDVAREMASYISPRAGATPHPLTTLAAAHMTDLVERAVHSDTEAATGRSC
jgi:hypothetical protein